MCIIQIAGTGTVVKESDFKKVNGMDNCIQYKCPCCGASLEFSPQTQKLSCQGCGNQYDLETMEQYEQEERLPGEQDLNWEYRREGQGAGKTEDSLYICPSCGAKIEADEDTVSTVCPYCDNVVVIKETFSGEFEPDVMIPFKIEGDLARQKMTEFCKGKPLLPKSFRDLSYLKDLRGCYVPYWLFDCKANADMSFNATRVRSWSDSEYNYVETSYYLVSRSGTMEFVHVPVDGSKEIDDNTTESIEPFDYSELTDFQPAYLAGYETDKYDVDAKDAEGRAKQRLYNSAEKMIRSTVTGYESVQVKRRHLTSQDGKVLYALLPVWLFETVYEGKKYQFAINGQTGKIVGELPVDPGAYLKYLCKFTAIGTVACSIIGILLFGGVL